MKLELRKARRRRTQRTVGHHQMHPLIARLRAHPAKHFVSARQLRRIRQGGATECGVREAFEVKGRCRGDGCVGVLHDERLEGHVHRACMYSVYMLHKYIKDIEY